jgi:hypothetical protein
VKPRLEAEVLILTNTFVVLAILYELSLFPLAHCSGSLVYNSIKVRRSTSVTQLQDQDRPPRHSTHISITTPVVSALKKLLHLELSRSANGHFINHFCVDKHLELEL